MENIENNVGHSKIWLELEERRYYRKANLSRLNFLRALIVLTILAAVAFAK